MATIGNSNMATLTGGTKMYYPLIAVESYCVLRFANGAAGEIRTITAGGVSVAVTMGTDGTAEMSLLPFMRLDMEGRNVQALPSSTSWRGSITLDVSLANSSDIDTSVTIYYIFGYFRPAKVMDSDVWITYNSADGDYNVVGVDLASHYTNGVPNSIAAFCDIYSDPSTWGGVNTFVVLQVASSTIYTGNRTYHLADDCRTDGIKQVRWIDADGCLNTRKFANAGENVGASRGDNYRRYRNGRTIQSMIYDFGNDEWASIEAQRTITIGDDAIPQNQWEWIKGLVTSPSVEVREGGLWVRCNIGETTMERDPRKDVFTCSITLVMPTDDIQQF